jgi:dihydrodipicolinate synthase/N-acetylneuraminate lyase
MNRADVHREQPLVRIAGIVGTTAQAIAEAELLVELGYHAGLLSLAALDKTPEKELIEHCRRVGDVIPIIGFYLQSAVGGRFLSHTFWRCLAELPSLIAVKIAPFDRYRTIDVIRALAEAGRSDVALFTGNDDNIILDLLTPFRFAVNGEWVERRIVGGLLGQWSVWTKTAVDIFDRCRRIASQGGDVPADMLRLNAELTDANAAVFDAANGFAGVVAGVHEVLRRQGLMEGTWCLDPAEGLSPGQAKALDRVTTAYPHLTDDAFVRENLSQWMA